MLITQGGYKRCGPPRIFTSCWGYQEKPPTTTSVKRTESWFAGTIRMRTRATTLARNTSRRFNEHTRFCLILKRDVSMIRDSTPLPEGLLANHAPGPVQEREGRVLRLLQISPTSWVN